VDAAELLAAATERLAPALDIHEIRLEPQIDCEGETILADRARTTRLVYRLLMRPRGARPRVGGDSPREPLRTMPGSRHRSRGNRTTFENGLLLDLRIASAVATSRAQPSTLAPRKHRASCCGCHCSTECQAAASMRVSRVRRFSAP